MRLFSGKSINYGLHLSRCHRQFSHCLNSTICKICFRFPSHHVTKFDSFNRTNSTETNSFNQTDKLFGVPFLILFCSSGKIQEIEFHSETNSESEIRNCNAMHVAITKCLSIYYMKHKKMLPVGVINQSKLKKEDAMNDVSQPTKCFIEEIKWFLNDLI